MATKTRLRKIECEECGFIARAAAGALRHAGMPTCGCGGATVVPELRDLVDIDPDAFEELANSLAPRARTAAMRILGYDQAIQTTKRHGTSQCSKRGCKRLRQPLELVCQPCKDAESVPF